jgi:hypothetical protein
MVGDRREVETDLFGAPAVAHQGVRIVLFRHQFIAELDH